MRGAISPLSIHLHSVVSLRDLFHEAVGISDYTAIEDCEVDGFESGCGLF